VVFYPTNGVGLGHVTRLLAVARRLGPEREPVFFTPCHALAVIEHAGFRTEYVPEPLHDETAPHDHARAMAPRLLAALRHYRPAAVVFDGNVPREALLAACTEADGTPTIWVRRGMWRADPALARHLALSRFFDAVIEPGDVAAQVDEGVTARAEDAPVAVPPVMLLDRGDVLEPLAARRALGLAADRPAALVQLGSGNNNDIERHLDHVVEAAGRLGIQLVVAEWLIQHNPVRRRGVRYLSAFPNARYFRAFDFAVSAAGYNSFHELLHHGLPCIFLPNDNQKVDDQRARAAFAEREGAAVCVPRGAESALSGYMAAMLDPALRRLVSRRARALCPVNGAQVAAGVIETVIARG
jgi:UDP:flavonoid glycosyltransferase YjiC (YdhE family)